MKCLAASLFIIFGVTSAFAQAPNAVIATVNGVPIRQARVDEQLAWISTERNSANVRGG
jgi:hypothetical protein